MFEDIGLWQNGSATITGRGEPEQVQTLNVTDGTLPVLGVRARARPRLLQGRRPAQRPEGGHDLASLLAARVRQQPVRDRPDADGQRRSRAKSSACCPRASASSRQIRPIFLPFKIDRATIHAAGFSYQGIARLKPGVSASSRPMPTWRACCRR